jgi:hypothetical protein
VRTNISLAVPRQTELPAADMAAGVRADMPTSSAGTLLAQSAVGAVPARFVSEAAYFGDRPDPARPVDRGGACLETDNRAVTVLAG